MKIKTSLFSENFFLIVHKKANSSQNAEFSYKVAFKEAFFIFIKKSLLYGHFEQIRWRNVRFLEQNSAKFRTRGKFQKTLLANFFRFFAKRRGIIFSHI